MEAMVDSPASFIPKNSSNTPKRRVRPARRIYVLSYVSYILFFGSLLAALGLFFYSAQISKTLEATAAELSAAQTRFSLSDFARIQAFDDKLKTADRLLEGLAAPSRLFAELESVVAANVYFSGFKYEAYADDTYALDLTGKATDLNQILYQSDLLNKSQILESAVVGAFDYAPLETADSNGRPQAANETIAALAAGEDPVITFHLVMSDALANIPYVPAQLQEENNTETTVVSVRPENTGDNNTDEDITSVTGENSN